MHYRSESGASADSRSNFVQLIETEGDRASGGNVTLHLMCCGLYLCLLSMVVVDTAAAAVTVVAAVGDYRSSLLFCSLAVLDPRVGHTMDVLSPFISILCHSD